MNYENWEVPKGQLEIVKLLDGSVRIKRCINGIPVESNQPDRLTETDQFVDTDKMVCDSQNSMET